MVAALAITVGLVSLLPVGYLFVAGSSAYDIARLFGYSTTVPTIVRTVGLTITVDVLALVLGVATALLVVRTDLPLRRLCTVLFAMPLAVPGFTSAYAAYSANLVYAPHWRIVSSFAGASLVMALTLYPYVFLSCVVALRNIDPAQEEMAHSLRSRRGAAFWHVMAPQLRPALAASLLIVSLHVLAEYGAMVQLGQRTLTTTIMAEMINFGDYRSARSLSMLLAGFAVLVLLVTRALAGRSVPLTVGSGSVRPPRPHALGRWRPAAVATSMVVPLLALGPTALMTVRGLVLPHGQQATDWTSVLHALGTTATYAAWAAAAGTAVALPVSWWVSRRGSLAAQLTERSVWVAHAVPNAILALALVYLSTRLLPGLYKTALLLVVAYVILYLPLAVSNQRVGMQAAPGKYDDMAASLGSRACRRFTRVSLPLALPGVGTGALLVGLDSSKELTTTLMLLPFNTHTLATGLWATTNGESLDFTAAAPFALTLVLLGSIPVFLIVRHTLRHITLTPVRQPGRQPARVLHCSSCAQAHTTVTVCETQGRQDC